MSGSRSKARARGAVRATSPAVVVEQNANHNAQVDPAQTASLVESPARGDEAASVVRALPESLGLVDRVVREMGLPRRPDLRLAAARVRTGRGI